MSRMLSIALMLILPSSCIAAGIHKAVYNNDLMQVRHFVNLGTDVYMQTFENKTVSESEHTREIKEK